MAAHRPQGPAGGSVPLLGSRTRSYGSLVRSPLSPPRHGGVEHRVQPGETLQGLALKYGVSMEQIKRANRMYTNDSIFLKRSLYIPLPPEPRAPPQEPDRPDAGRDSGQACAQNGSVAMEEGAGRASELSPVDFLKRMDGLISRSKQAAVKGCRDAEERVAALEAVCASAGPERRRLPRSRSAAACHGRTRPDDHVAIPLTVTKLTMTLRDREDELFQL